MHYRKAIPDDAQNIAILGMSVWIDTYAAEGVRQSFSDYTTEEFNKNSVAEIIEKKHVFVAENDKHLLGYMVISADEKELETLYILSHFRRKGMGKKFLEIALNRNAELHLSCWESNISAIKFYKACGFSEIGETYFFLEQEKHRNIVLQHETAFKLARRKSRAS